jgi:hypothetical protein
MMVLRNENNFMDYGGLIVIVTRTRTAASAVCTREITGVDEANDVFGSIEGGRTD